MWAWASLRLYTYKNLTQPLGFGIKLCELNPSEVPTCRRAHHRLLRAEAQRVRTCAGEGIRRQNTGWDERGRICSRKTNRSQKQRTNFVRRGKFIILYSVAHKKLFYMHERREVCKVVCMCRSESPPFEFFITGIIVCLITRLDTYL